jgi:TRAP-type mannitol/chloroaromatic compound transport system permease small subunit
VRFLVGLANVIDRIISGIGRTVTWLALALIAVIVFDVITRRFLVLGSTKLQELEWHIHTLLFMFCVGWAYLADAHVRIDLVRQHMSERTQQWIEFFGCLLFAVPYTAIMFYLSIDFAYSSFVQGEISSAGTGLAHRWIIKACLGLGLVLLLLASVCVMVRSFVLLFGPPELAQEVRALMTSRSGFAMGPEPGAGKPDAGPPGG